MASVAVNKKNSIGIIVDESMKDYSNDPFVLKKAAKAGASIKKYGLPKKNKKKPK